MANAASLYTQNPDARSAIAWCSPPQKFTARSTSPWAIARAAPTDPPAINAASSCIPGKIGLSAVPKPCPTENGKPVATPGAPHRCNPTCAPCPTSRRRPDPARQPRNRPPRPATRPTATSTPSATDPSDDDHPEVVAEHPRIPHHQRQAHRPRLTMRTPMTSVQAGPAPLDPGRGRLEFECGQPVDHSAGAATAASSARISDSGNLRCPPGVRIHRPSRWMPTAWTVLGRTPEKHRSCPWTQLFGLVDGHAATSASGRRGSSPGSHLQAGRRR